MLGHRSNFREKIRVFPILRSDSGAAVARYRHGVFTNVFLVDFGAVWCIVCHILPDNFRGRAPESRRGHVRARVAENAV